MAKRKYIDDFINEMKLEAEWQSPSDVEDAKEAITKVVVNRLTESAKKRKVIKDMMTDGKLKVCPPGYHWDKKKMDCLPNSPQNSSSGNRDSHPSNAPNYRTWGKNPTDGYAYAEPDNWDTDAYNGPSGSYYQGGGFSEAKGDKVRDVLEKCIRCGTTKRNGKCRCLGNSALMDIDD